MAARKKKATKKKVAKAAKEKAPPKESEAYTHEFFDRVGRLLELEDKALQVFMNSGGSRDGWSAMNAVAGFMLNRFEHRRKWLAEFFPKRANPSKKRRRRSW